MKTYLLLLFFLFPIGIYAQNIHVYPNESIQQAINNAQSGDVILIHAGVYTEAVSIVNRTNLTLSSAGDGTVILQGDGNRVNTIEIDNPTNISVTGLTIKNIRKQAWSTGIAVVGSGSGITITNNKFTDFSYHPGAWDASDNPGDNIEGVNPLMVAGTETSAPLSDVLIDGNEVSYCITGWNESITVKGNVDGFTVTNNTVHHVTNIAIDAYGLGDWPNAMQARNGQISHNTVYEAKCNYTDNGGIYVDGGKDIVISNNTIYNSIYGITVGCENQGNVANGVTSGITIINNLVYNNDQAGLMVGTSGDDDGLQGEVTNCYISGNTFLKNSTTDSWGSELVLQYCNQISVYNNIIYGLYQPMITEALGVTNNEFGYNAFYNSTGMSPIISKQTASGWTSVTFQQFKNNNNDQSSFFADPLLVNADISTIDVHLSTSSPCIDGGSPSYIPIPGEIDLDGEARIHNGRLDIGADEFGSSTPSSLPSPWQTADIGNVQIEGSAVYNDGSFTLEGAGNDIWGEQDQFRYMYQTISGDGTMIVKINSLTNTNAWTKAGIMLRDNLSPSAAHSFLALTPSNGVAFQHRASEGAGSNHQAGGNGTTPLWLKLVRSGSSFTGYTSNNGSTWTLVGNQNINMNNDIYIGLALTSHDNTQLSVASFSELTISTTDEISITIDGNLDDWATISPLDAKDNQTAQWLKVHGSESDIFFSIKGSGMNSSNYHLYINGDDDSSTGYQITDFAESGAEYMIENGTLYQNTGNGNSWARNNIGTVSSAKSATATEVRVSRSQLSLANNFLTGYADLSSSWSTISTLGFSSYNLAEETAARKASSHSPNSGTIIYPNPVRDVLTINLGEYDGETQVYLYDINGRLLLQEATQKALYFITAEIQQLNAPAILKIVKDGSSETFKVLPMR